jgi:hypothetical protein
MDRRGDRDGESSWSSLGERLQSLKELIMANTFPEDCVFYTHLSPNSIPSIQNESLFA